MNERIRAIGADMGILDPEGKFYSPNYEIFAELIVRECAYIARQCYTVRAIDAEDVAKHIEETFELD